MAKKERLIELLQEKRTAAITARRHQGPRPVRPHEGLRRRGYGEIPAHSGGEAAEGRNAQDRQWEDTVGRSEVYVSDGVMFLRSQNVHFGALRLDDVAFVDCRSGWGDGGRSVRGEGDVLLNIAGASLGGAV